MTERMRTHWLRKSFCLATTVALVVIGTGIVGAEPFQGQKKSTPSSPKDTKTASGKPTAAEPAGKQASEPAKPAVNPSNIGPIVAKVNGEEITYKALAEEVIIREGAKVLETMISRRLVEQATRDRGIKITAQEIHDEITRTAQRMNMTPEGYLKLLKDKRQITYEQYERDIVRPGLALKKMAKKDIKVTEEDIEKGFEAYYGEKVKCRWIMVDNLQKAMQVWNELMAGAKKGDGKVPVGEFERMVSRYSTDPGTASLGGQLQPISRHTGPMFKNIEEAAFALAEDGEISKVVQFGESWVILWREGRIPPRPVKLDDVRKDIETDIYEAKMTERIKDIFEGIQKGATIENLLTGEVSSPDKNTVPAAHQEKAKQEPAKPTTKEQTPRKGPTPSKK